MNKPLIHVFTIKCQDAYTAKLSTAAKNIANQRITHTTSEDELQEIKNRLVQSTWSWDKMLISDGPFKAEHDRIELGIREAGDLIGNGFSYSLSSNTTVITHVRYTIPFESGSNVFAQTVTLNERYLPITISGSHFIIHLFTQKALEEVAAQLKEQRDSIINLLKQNQVEVDAFWESKKEIFRTDIAAKADLFLENVKKKNDLNDLLT